MIVEMIDCPKHGLQADDHAESCDLFQNKKRPRKASLLGILRQNAPRQLHVK